jgi:hypothetical protein
LFANVKQNGAPLRIDCGKPLFTAVGQTIKIPSKRIYSSKNSLKEKHEQSRKVIRDSFIDNIIFNIWADFIAELLRKRFELYEALLKNI